MFHNVPKAIRLSGASVQVAARPAARSAADTRSKIGRSTATREIPGAATATSRRRATGIGPAGAAGAFGGGAVAADAPPNASSTFEAAPAAAPSPGPSDGAGTTIGAAAVVLEPAISSGVSASMPGGCGAGGCSPDGSANAKASVAPASEDAGHVPEAIVVSCS